MKHRILTACAVFLLSVACAQAMELGSLSGVVKEPMGQPAVGVAISIRSQGSILPIERKTLSNLKGQFQFLSLFPGTYTLEVVALQPWNVISRQLVVAPGKNDPLVIHLSDIFTMAFKPPRITTERGDPIDDSKWVLRTSRITRPILRFKENPEVETVAENSAANSTLPFRGILEISSMSDLSSAGGNVNPFNSSFAFVHPLSPRTQLLVAGGVGFSGSNQTSVRSALNIKLDESHTATVSVGLRQFGLPLLSNSELTQALASLSGGNTAVSQIQNFFVSLDLQDRFKLGDHLELMGGAAFDHVESVRTRNILRPRIGITADLSPTFSVRALAMNTTPERAKTFNLPEGETITLPAVARLSVSPNSARPESVNHFELSFEQVIANQTRLIVDLYQDQFKDRVLFINRVESMNVGGSAQRGYSIALITRPRQKVSASLGYTYAGGLEEADFPLTATDAFLDESQRLRTRYYHVITGGLGFQLPRTQTQITSVYRKILGTSLTIIDPFQSNFFASEGGLNLLITQPLPNFTMLPGQLEAQADFRNLFAEGSARPGSVLPIAFLSQQPRVIRGGLSFKF